MSVNVIMLSNELGICPAVSFERSVHWQAYSLSRAGELDNPSAGICKGRSLVVRSTMDTVHRRANLGCCQLGAFKMKEGKDPSKYCSAMHPYKGIDVCKCMWRWTHTRFSPSLSLFTVTVKLYINMYWNRTTLESNTSKLNHIAWFYIFHLQNCPNKKWSNTSIWCTHTHTNLTIRN